MIRYKIRIALLTFGVFAGYTHGIMSLTCGSRCNASSDRTPCNADTP